ncbi:MAG: hypothetical protein A2787_10085 [Omnitrophica WOR_2 bacterium RIFCSPHIGHO2_01_FULL_48_9]|nr:MAG: hypothetical protein A3D10_04605 [Omnitrophica WOR_2 bacterium RIFCSPHIGHO2_02_FULL_48_11]OGX31472.1 MAG: hypothetical protein A2787_10085 [Omnitrophica WOR_2 bacterium RIFCSPHIGHO2_01_FULL_48_9]
MLIKQTFSERVEATLREWKTEFRQRPEELSIPVKDRGTTIAFLQPICADLGERHSEVIALLAEWRERDWDAYPTVFKVTREGTARWMQAQLIDRKDRILFLLVTPQQKIIGHLGLSNFDFAKCEAEIDSVVRGEKGILPGVMTKALEALTAWTLDELGVKRLLLRVFSDNATAIKLYERCGFKREREIPLHKIQEGDVIQYEEILPGQNLSVDRIFLLMNFSADKSTKGRR